MQVAKIWIHIDAFSRFTARPWLFVVLAVALLASCEFSQQKTPLQDRPMVHRTVLDLHPRLAIVQFSEDILVAFDTEQCYMTQVWKGGIRWEGAPYTGVKNTQPTTWGSVFTRHAQRRDFLLVRKDGQILNLEPQFVKYVIGDEEVVFSYQFEVDQSKVLVTDRFELASAPTTLRRTLDISLTGPPLAELYVIQEGEEIPFDGELQIDYSLDDPLEVIPRHDPSNQASIGKLWYDRSGCGTCHRYQQKEIGPSLAAIADRYDPTEEDIDYLVNKIKVGGAGVWGSVAMTPHAHLTDKDIRHMVNYILSLSELEASGEDEARETAEVPNAPATAPEDDRTPGFGTPLTGIHPSFDLRTIRPTSFQPKVGALDFMSDGSLLLTTWDSLGAVYRIEGLATNDTSQMTITQIAQGLDEPLGMRVVDDEIFVLQKHELTKLVDTNDDWIIDEFVCVSNQWDVSADFHEFAFGLEYHKEHFYLTLSLAMRLMAQDRQQSQRGTVLKIDPTDGSFEPICHGLRTPNGIHFDQEGNLYVTDNQGQWLPGNKLIRVTQGAFYGNRDVVREHGADIRDTPPTLWLPQDEIANSPTEPLQLETPSVYRGQIIFGDVTHGGIKRAFIEEIEGIAQGAVFRFSQGLEAGVNRIRYDPSGNIVVGGVGMNGNWAWQNKTFGLQKLEYNGRSTFEMVSVAIEEEAFRVAFTEPIDTLTRPTVASVSVEQWRYEPTASYGGPKIDWERLPVQDLNFSDDRLTMEVRVEGLKANRVVYLQLDENDFKSQRGRFLWSGDCWYTINALPKSAK
ncbi:MAG: c-type cytochrome [Bacteroidota bacterium]